MASLMVRKDWTILLKTTGFQSRRSLLLKPCEYMSFICLRMVDLPDSPAPAVTQRSVAARKRRGFGELKESPSPTPHGSAVYNIAEATAERSNNWTSTRRGREASAALVADLPRRRSLTSLDMRRSSWRSMRSSSRERASPLSLLRLPKHISEKLSEEKVPPQSRRGQALSEEADGGTSLPAIRASLEQ